MSLTRTEQRVLFTAIAFAAVAQRQDNLETPAATEKIRVLAELIERYCVETVMKPAAILNHGFGYSEEQEAELLLSLIRDRQQHVDRLAA
jgi:hypothetical protein